MSTDHVQRGTTAAGGLLGVSGMSFHPKVYAKKQTGNINNAAVESLTKKAATTGYRNRAEQPAHLLLHTQATVNIDAESRHIKCHCVNLLDSMDNHPNLSTMLAETQQTLSSKHWHVAAHLLLMLLLMSMPNNTACSGTHKTCSCSWQLTPLLCITPMQAASSKSNTQLVA